MASPTAHKTLGFLQLLLLGLVLLTSTVRAEEPIQFDAIYEPVCPLDTILVELRDGYETNESGETQRRQLLETDPTALPIIEIVRQGDDYVEFIVHNTTDFEKNDDDTPFVADHIFVNYEYNVYKAETCPLFEDMGAADLPGSATDIRKATCFHTAHDNKIALVRVYVRSLSGRGQSASIPKCCHDPYAEDGTVGDYSTVEYTFAVQCSPSCEDPDNYNDDNNNNNDDNGGDDDNGEDDDSLTTFPSASPVVGEGDSDAPTTNFPTQVPTTFVPTEDENQLPPLFCPDAGKQLPLSRDMVMGSQLNGPHWGSRHSWAWPGSNNNGCDWYQYVDNDGSNAYAAPCSVSTQMVSNRVLNFDSSYMNFQFDFDGGMEATISLPTGESLTFFPKGVPDTACGPPPEKSWTDYPVRLVKSGRYYHHWYAEQINCNGEDNDSRIDIKVTSDCVELYLVSNNGAENVNWIESGEKTPLADSLNGYVGISYCVQCDSEMNGSPNDDLSGCSIVEKPLPTDCCPLNGAKVGEPALCGTGWEYGTCSDTSVARTDLTNDVGLTTTPNYPITADGHSFHVQVPRGSGNQLSNDSLVVNLQNVNLENKWQKVKVNFHIEKPRRMTGVSGVLMDPNTGKPSGIHVQMSKNWHVERNPALYDGYWWTGIAHIRIPPGETSLKLVIAYQYYSGLHGVSHSQLSLLGWATNGLWEEVGLGANGESITYEPHGHHRRQMILDTRPWLTCALGAIDCKGSPDSTQWTENVGGGDFLNAVNKKGMYQYLVKDTVFHTMNGPRLTNATYTGVTVDQNIGVSRTVSTSTADDFVRHLHSFEYTFLKDTAGDNYPRFALYTLGGDNYNYVRYPMFAYGSGDTNTILEESGGDVATIPVKDIIEGFGDFRYTNYYSIDAPKGCTIGSSGSCWFAMLTDPSNNIHQRGHRGVIVRNFRGRLNGEAWPPSNADDVSPFTFNLIKSRNNNAAKDTASIEIGLPASFKAAVDLGLAKFMEGDFLAADIELLIPPRQNADYFGNSERLRAWMTEAGVDSDYKEGWKLISKEASEGDAIVTTVFAGELERQYHPRVKVDCPGNVARFNVAIPEGMPGILPISIAGVTTTEIAGPLDGATAAPKLWRFQDGGWKEFAIGGGYQLEKDVLENTYTFVYSLVLEFQNDNSGPPVQSDCEQFYFGAVPPSDTNPPCA